MFDDKNDVRHLFRCQRTIATSDGWPGVGTKRCCFFLSMFFWIVYEIRDKKINRHSSIKLHFR